MSKLKIFGLICLIFGCMFFLSLCGMGMKWCGQAKQVIQEEVSPKALLNKYMWFKDAAAMLDKHIADARALKSKINNLGEMYEGEKRRDWARVDAEQQNLWLSEVDGIKTAFTNLAAEYNAQMSKINFAFCNRGALPKGADKPLPKEYAPYSAIIN